jgi:hypothetical protein
LQIQVLSTTAIEPVSRAGVVAFAVAESEGVALGNVPGDDERLSSVFRVRRKRRLRPGRDSGAVVVEGFGRRRSRQGCSVGGFATSEGRLRSEKCHPSNE